MRAMTMNDHPLLQAAEFRRLVRLCAFLSRDREAAEDLAQETLLEAWRNLHKLHDPAGADRWLTAIARNVCRRWARERGRELPAVSLVDVEPSALDERLERTERRELIGRALELVPEETRDVLVQRYVFEASNAETGQRLGLTEAAVSMRLARGKAALIRILRSDLRDEAEALGLVTPEQIGWRATRIWCRKCGQGTLRVAREERTGVVYFQCTGCEGEDEEPGSQFRLDNPVFGRLLGSVARPSTMLRRIADWSWRYFTAGAESGSVSCTRCGLPAPLRPYARPHLDVSSRYGLASECAACGEAVSSSVAALAGSAPVVRRFHRDHPRTRAVVAEDEGSLAVSFEDLEGRGTVGVAFARDTLRVVDERLSA